MSIAASEPTQPAQDHASTDRKYLGELLRNQLWQSAGFLSKAVFLFVLTPLMVGQWGPARYGLFALASSLLVSMGLLDGGVRALTRVRLAEALGQNDRAAFQRAFGSGVLTFTSVVLTATGLFALAAATGKLEVWFGLPPEGSLVLTVTTALTACFMISNLTLEPLAAEGRLSVVKAANTWGAIASIPLCFAVVKLGGGVLPAVIVNLACTVVPNGLLFFANRVGGLFPWHDRALWSWRTIWTTLRAGFWYYLTTISLVMKGHAFTFIVAAIAGPAEAGLFYILLRITEVLVNVGSTSSETSLASLAGSPDAASRRRNFQHCWSYVAIFCAHSAIALAILGEPLLNRWLPDHPHLGAGLGIALAISGLSGALSRVAVNASMGLGKVDLAARANLVEALFAAALGTAGYYAAGLAGLLIGSSIGTFAMLPVLISVARQCESGFVVTFLKPLIPLLPGILAAATAQAIAASLGLGWPLLIGAMLISATVALLQFRQVHRAKD